MSNFCGLSGGWAKVFQKVDPISAVSQRQSQINNNKKTKKTKGPRNARNVRKTVHCKKVRPWLIKPNLWQ